MNQRFESCAEIRAALPLWVGGDLEAIENGAVQSHLDFCDSCRGAAELADQARCALVQRLENEVGQAPDLWSGVRAELVADGQFDRPVLAGPGSWMRRAGVGVAAAAAALFVTFSVADRILPSGATPDLAVPPVGALADAPSLPGISLPVVASEVTLGKTAQETAPGAEPDEGQRLRRMGPRSVELWRNAEVVGFDSLRLLRDEARLGGDSGMRLTGDQ